MLLALFFPTAHAACVTNSTFSEVLDAVVQAEDAYRVLDRDLLESRVASAESRLTCLGDPIGRDLAASFHRMEALYAFLKKDEITAILYFGASRSIMPGYKFPEDLVPADNYIQTLYKKLDISTLTRVSLPAAAEGKILFDGIETTERPKDVPTIFQIVDAANKAVITQLLMPSDPPPYYKPVTGPVASKDPVTPRQDTLSGLPNTSTTTEIDTEAVHEKKDHKSKAGAGIQLGLSGLIAAGSAGLLLYSNGLENELQTDLEKDTISMENANEQAAWINTLYGISYGGYAVSAGLLVGGIATIPTSEGGFVFSLNGKF